MTSKNSKWVRSVLAAGAAAIGISGVASGANAWGAWGAWVNGASPNIATCMDGQIGGGAGGRGTFRTTGWSWYTGANNNSLRAFSPAADDTGGYLNFFSRTEAQGFPFVNGANPTVTACYSMTGWKPAGAVCATTTDGTAMRTVPVSLTHSRCRNEVMNNINGGDI